MPYTPTGITEESGEGVDGSHSCCELDVDCERVCAGAVEFSKKVKCEILKILLLRQLLRQDHLGTTRKDYELLAYQRTLQQATPTEKTDEPLTNSLRLMTGWEYRQWTKKKREGRDKKLKNNRRSFSY